MTQGIEGKVVVITGASSGLGEATARLLASEGAKPVRGRYANWAIPAESFARCVAFAMNQPDEVDINEILFRPMVQAY